MERGKEREKEAGRKGGWRRVRRREGRTGEMRKWKWEMGNHLRSHSRCGRFGSASQLVWTRLWNW